MYTGFCPDNLGTGSIGYVHHLPGLFSVGVSADILYSDIYSRNTMGLTLGRQLNKQIIIGVRGNLVHCGYNSENFVYGEGDTAVPFKPNEITHIQFYNPSNDFYGAGPTSPSEYNINTNTYAKIWNMNFFKQSALPKGVLYTDGITEAMDAQGREFGRENLIEAVTVSSGKNPGDIGKNINGRLARFTGGVAQHDDMTLLVLKRY